MKEHMLVGKTLTGVMIADDKEAILFQTTDGDIVARCDGDCCSHTWIENVENTIASFPAVVTGARDVDMPDHGQPEYGAIAYYGFTISTDKGSLVIDYRNESNGYYGGSLSWPDDGYYYGGVYGQNISKEQWKPLA